MVQAKSVNGRSVTLPSVDAEGTYTIQTTLFSEDHGMLYAADITNHFSLYLGIFVRFQGNLKILRGFYNNSKNPDTPSDPNNPYTVR